MNIFLRFYSLVAAFICLPLFCHGQYVLEKGGTLGFSKTDHISLPTYEWDRTLVSYPVEFSPALASEDDICLVDEVGGEYVPYQLSDKVIIDGRIVSGKVNFFAELPSGGSFSYKLLYERHPASMNGSEVSMSETDSTLSLDNGVFSLILPKSCHPGRTAGGFEIEDLSTGIRAVSVLKSSLPQISSVNTSVIEKGRLFVLCRTDYVFDNGAEYSIFMKTVSGYPFIIMEETINGLRKVDDVCLEVRWDNFEPEYRYPTQWDRKFDRNFPWYRIDEPVRTNYCKEDPAWTGMGMIEDPSRQMIFRLTPFGGNSVREQTPLISFWGDGPRELGVFVYDHAKWNDRQYGVWQPTPDLCVYFRYTDDKLFFTYPVCDGCRSTAIAIYDKASGEAECAAFSKAMTSLGGAMKESNTAYRYMNLLHSRYALFNLDKVKDWVLEYPESARRADIPFKTEVYRSSVEGFMKEMRSSAMGYYMAGLNSYPGVHSIEHRQVYGRYLQEYLTYLYELEDADRKQVEALFLLAGYVNMTEAMNALRTSIAGTPNMAADGWSMTGIAAAVFPEHPMSQVWEAYFRKSLELYGLFYTRPDVPVYESEGGRWTESLGIYNWAYLKPVTAANLALVSETGRNALANKYMAERGRWMVDMLTAPVEVTTAAYPGKHLQRVYPAHGAHSGGRFVPQFSYVYQLGSFLENYDPMTAEYLHWCNRMGAAPEGKPYDSNWDYVFSSLYDSKDTGTDPHLTSKKYTGHGIVLRAGVGTDEELSIHLEQVDKGPNYRWGNQGEGNSGGIYYYASGNIYSGHENESAGDHIQNNTDNVCNFGVMKNGNFMTVGYNELKSPMFDLGIAQFAEVRSDENSPYSSYPEYLGRSVMLVGTDYFLIFDEAGTNWRASNRFSWFVHNEDRLPTIIFFGNNARKDHWTVASTAGSYGFYRDAIGSQLTLVSHRNDISVLDGDLVKSPVMPDEPVYEYRPGRGTVSHDGMYQIETAKGRDIVFRSGKRIECAGANYSFAGTAGVARRMNDGSIHLALFRGEEISYGKVSMKIAAEKECAVAVKFDSPVHASGKFSNYGKALLEISGVRGGSFYIDGEAAVMSGEKLILPEGIHTIEYTGGVPVPMPSEIASTEHVRKGAEVHLRKPSSVVETVVEISEDGGLSWKEAGRTTDDIFVLSGLPKGKYHVRAVSVNDDVRALSAPEYPVYVDSKAPHYPEGLTLKLSDGCAELSWGQVLGVRTYRVYKKAFGSDRYDLLYEGQSNDLTDQDSSIRKYAAYPDDMAISSRESDKFVSYYVTAVNGRGESDPSPSITADPKSWALWYPDTELKFKRRSAFWMPPYVSPDMVPPKYYPDFPEMASPEKIGAVLTEKFIADPFSQYGSPLRVQEPRTQVTYPDVCAWLGGLWFAEKTGNIRLQEALKEKFDPLLDSLEYLLPAPNHVDNNVFGAVPLELYLLTGDARYRNLGLMYADSQWQLPAGWSLDSAHVQKSLIYGDFQDAGLFLEPQKEWHDKGYSWQTRFWLDDMFMITAVQSQAFRVTGDRKYINRAAKEMVLYLEKMQKPSGLFDHGPGAPFAWSRANGWMAVGMAELLRMLPEDSKYRDEIMDGYLKMMSTLLEYQNTTGMWRQVIDDPSMWDETSGTAMFTYAMIVGVKNGWLKDRAYLEAVRKGWMALCGTVDSEGLVSGVCEGTMLGSSSEYYRQRKKLTGDVHGLAPILWCAAALID